MAATARVTVTLPSDLVEQIDRLERNRSRFVLEGVRRELQRRRRETLRQSLRSPHPESAQPDDEDFHEWMRSLPREDAEDLVDPTGGTPVRWTPGQGWTKERR